MKIVDEKLGIDLLEKINFYEYISNFICSSDKNPMTTISNVFSGCKILPEINSILEEDVSLYNLKIIPKDSILDQKEWFEITIEPNRINPTKTFSIVVVFRSSDPSKFETRGKNMINYLRQIIELIES